jgi:hypothetical protein
LIGRRLRTGRRRSPHSSEAGYFWLTQLGYRGASRGIKRQILIGSIYRFYRIRGTFAMGDAVGKRDGSDGANGDRPGGGNSLPFARFTAPPANEHRTLSSDREN